jgi:transcriptional regulator with XRE-family HTH domain
MSRHRLPNAALSAFLRDRRLALRATDFASLRKARGRSSLSQEQVAELIGVSRQWYLKFEAGHIARPTLSLIGRVAAALRLGDADALRLLHLAASTELPAAASAACAAQGTVEAASSALGDRVALGDRALPHVASQPRHYPRKSPPLLHSR